MSTQTLFQQSLECAEIPLSPLHSYLSKYILGWEGGGVVAPNSGGEQLL